MRDAPTIGDQEEAVVIDVCATLRTLLEQYTASEDVEPTRGGLLDWIKPKA